MLTSCSASAPTSRLPAGPFYVYAVARRSGNNAYRPKVILNPDGTVSVHVGAVVNNVESSLAPAVVVPGLTHGANCVHLDPGTGVWDAAQRRSASRHGQTGSRNRPTGSTWQQTRKPALQGPGGVGVRAYLAGTVNNSPVLVSFDELLVRAVP